MKLRYNQFVDQFENLCKALDIDPKFKMDTCDIWYKSKLAYLTEDQFDKLIVYLTDNCESNSNKLPSVPFLLRTYYEKVHSRQEAIDCSICDNDRFVILVNTWTGKEFAVRCTCILDTKRKPYTDFLEFNPEKFMLLDEYIRCNGQSHPPIHGPLANDLVRIISKAEEWNKERKIPF